MDKEKLIIGLLVLIIILSVVSIVMTFNINSEDEQTILAVEEDTGSSQINLVVAGTPENEVVE